MSVLASDLAGYLALRRALGYKLVDDGRQLAQFVAYLDACDTATVTVAAALGWATGTGHAGAGGGARRLTVVRGFARYLQAVDPAHEVPPVGLLPNHTTRPAPHLYTNTETAALMNAAKALEPPMWAATVETVIGLLWVTGMRIGEVLRLNVADIDTGGVATVWLSKFNKSRHVPLTASTITALTAYARLRRDLLPAAEVTTAVFVSMGGRRLSYQQFLKAFVSLLDTTGLSTGPGRRPRIHDFRHSFAVRTILGWYRDGSDVQALLPRLSTYLGHVAPSSTYWYLSAAPELMAVAAERLDRHREGAR